MNETILRVKKLSARYGQKKAVTDISFCAKKGEIIGIVGESGSGKSTLLKAILPIVYDGMTISSGTIMLQNKVIAHESEADRKELLGRKIGMIFQNPRASFNPIRTFRKQFVETLKSHGKYDSLRFESQVCEVFEKLNLKEGKRILNSYPFEMSGGMNQRIAIALAVLLKPVLLLADEPTSALDSMSKAQVLDELLRLRDNYNMTMIIVTHDMYAISKVADTIGVMYQGEMVEFGDAQAVLQNPQHDYTKKLLDAVPKIGTVSEGIRLNEGAPVLKLVRLSKIFLLPNKEMLQAVLNVNICLHAGETLGIVGESGSGKSTLIQMIAGLQKPSNGTIALKHKQLNDKREKTEYASIQMIFQHPIESFNPKRSIRSAIRESLYNLKGIKKKKEADMLIDQLMVQVGLNVKLANRYPSQLSGGECQRAAIARAIAVKPEVLLCDEVTSALDVSVQAEIVALLLRLTNTLGMAMIFVSHDIALVSNVCQRMIVMKDGECIEYGKTKEIINYPREAYTKRLIQSVISLEGATIDGEDTGTCSCILDEKSH